MKNFSIKFDNIEKKKILKNDFLRKSGAGNFRNKILHNFIKVGITCIHI